MFKRRILSALFSCSALPLVAAAPAPTMREVNIWLNDGFNYYTEMCTLQVNNRSTADLKQAVASHFGIKPECITNIRTIYHDFNGEIRPPFTGQSGNLKQIKVSDDELDIHPDKLWFEMSLKEPALLNAIGSISRNDLWNTAYELAIDNSSSSVGYCQTLARCFLQNNLFSSPYAQEHARTWLNSLNTSDLGLSKMSRDRSRALNKDFINMVYTTGADLMFEVVVKAGFIGNLLNKNGGMKPIRAGSDDEFGEELITLFQDAPYLIRLINALHDENNKQSVPESADDIIARMDRIIEFLTGTPHCCPLQIKLIELIRDGFIAKKQGTGIFQPGTPGANNPQLNPPLPAAPSSQWKTWAKYGGMTAIVLTAAYFGYQWFVAAPAQTSEEAEQA